MSLRLSGHAYPWDVLGDEAFADRVHRIGLQEVTLAAAYHSTRAATPLHPRHQIVEARTSALYRPIREAAWATSKLRPAHPYWMTNSDPYREAAVNLTAAGINVRAWVVLNHDSRLGTAHPGLAVRNCFAEHYRYALCPANPEVRRYATTLAVEAIRDAPCAGVSLEGCGQLGVGHVSQHDKTAGAWSSAATRLLSVCCCPACRSQWRAENLNPREVTTQLRRAVTAQAHDDTDDFPAELASALLEVRHRSFDLLRAEVTSAIKEVVGALPVTLHASPDPWATGPASGMTAKTTEDVDTLLVPAWPVTRHSATAVTEAAAGGLPVDAYVTALWPTDLDALSPHVARLIAAGASGIAFYHLGLANAAQQRAIATAIAETS